MLGWESALAQVRTNEMKFQANDSDSFPQCEQFARGSNPCERWNMIRKRVAILLLLIGLAGLGAQAKDGQYCRRTNPERETSLATKMNVPPAGVNFSAQPLRTGSRVVVEEPQQTLPARIEAEPPVAESVGVTVAMQHRSPPEPLHS